MDRITFVHLKKLLTCQEYFVWHKIEELNFQNNNNKNNKFEFKFPDVIDTIDPTITEIQVRTFNKVVRTFFEKTKKTGNVKWISKMLSIEEKIIETQKSLKDPLVDIIFEPVFEYQGAFASPTFYDKRTKKISNLKISTSTKRIDLIKPYFDYNIINKNKIKVNAISYFILDTKKYKAFEIAFYETFKIATSLKSRSDKKAKSEGDFVSIRKAKSGNSFKINGEPYEKFTIFDLVAKKKPFGNSKNLITFKSIDFYLKKIKEAKTIPFHNVLTEKDKTVFGTNPYTNIIIDNLYPNMQGYNRKHIQIKDIIANKTLKDIASENFVIQEILKNKIQVTDKKNLQKYIDKLENASKVVWYDFEGFYLPFPTIDGYMPFQQVTFQVSIIETSKMKEKNVINQIFDPQSFNQKEFPKLIDIVYSNQADFYVVFNDGYENTRLKEMLQILKNTNHSNYEDCKMKVNWIIDHTIDLSKPFSASSKTVLPKILIPELKAKYSIKLIENYITKNNYYFKNIIKPYKDLDVQNGVMAMEIAINRALNLIKDIEWKDKKYMLAEYCENDVRAIIMVYYFIKELLSY